MKKTIYILVFSLILAVLLTGSLLPSGMKKAGSSQVDWSAAGAKINPAVLDMLDGAEWVEVLVKVKGSVNTTQVAEKAAKRVSPGMDRGIKNLYIRHQVVTALRERAQYTQKPLLEFLKAQEKGGMVRDIQDYYIVNMIYAHVHQEVLQKLVLHPQVEEILPNSQVELKKPQAVIEEEITDAANSIEWNIEKIRAPLVWEHLGVSGEGVVIGIIDSGVSWEHEALKRKWRGYNPEEPDNPQPTFNWLDLVTFSQLPYDDMTMHGTHVTGIILGSEPQQDKTIGVAPEARWIAVKAFSNNRAHISDILAAGQYLLAPTDEYGIPHPNQAPHIINNSWGKRELDHWYIDMVESWRSAQIFPVFAAGNHGPEEGTISNPGHLPQSFTVGATDKNDNISEFSARGPGPYPGIKPDLTAPGDSILSSKPGGGYRTDSGTSMAAPHVTGTIALLLSLNPGLTVDELEEILKETSHVLTDDSYPDSPNYGYGYGRVDAYAAARWVEQSTCGVISGRVEVQGDGENLPVQARVTVLESGRKTDTDPRDGTFRMIHPATFPGEKITLQVESQGFKVAQKQIELEVQGYWQGQFLLEPKVPVTGVMLQESSLEISLRSDRTLEAQVIPYNASNKTLYWSSDNEQVLKVEKGRIIPLAPGTATITVTTQDGGHWADCRVTVVSLDRIYGSNRYLTAVEISREGWELADTVVLARGDDYADALAGVPLAYQMGAPILLTSPNNLKDSVRGEIKRLGAKSVILLGGTSALSMKVQGSLLQEGLQVERIAGENRFDTAAQIARKLAPDGVNTAVIAYGFNFPDAMSLASHAALKGYPLLLTRVDSLPQETAGILEELSVEQTVVAGGSQQVGGTVMNLLPQPFRVNGSDRYSTAVALAEYFNLNPPGLFVTTGLDFPDAVTGAVLAARHESSILLVHGDLTTPPLVHSVLEEFILDRGLQWITVLGGTDAVNLLTEEYLRRLAQEGNL